MFKIAFFLQRRTFAHLPLLCATSAENELFQFVKKSLYNDNISNGVRVAGGWLLDLPSDDIDIVIEGMSGMDLYHVLKKNENISPFSVSLLQSCPEKSKHIDSVVIQIGEWQIDCMQQRKESYPDKQSRIPAIEPGTLMQDTFRRDFTVNGLYYNLKEEQVEDVSGKGIPDLEAKQLKVLGENVEQRLMEDPLRGMRAIRFGVTYSFTVCPDILRVISSTTFKYRLRSLVSKIHISKELRKTLCASTSISCLSNFYRTGLLDFILFGEMEAKFPSSLLKDFFDTLNNDLESSFIIKLAGILSFRWSGLSFDELLDHIDTITKLLVLSKSEQRELSFLLSNAFHFPKRSNSKENVAFWMRDMGKEEGKWKECVKLSSFYCSPPSSLAERSTLVKQIEGWNITTKDLLDGSDICSALKIKPGKIIGSWKKTIFLWHLQNPSATKEDAIQFLLTRREDSPTK